jgi:hypothetical protein
LTGLAVRLFRNPLRRTSTIDSTTGVTSTMNNCVYKLKNECERVEKIQRLKI